MRRTPASPVTFDLQRLDQEWLEQPDMMYHAGTELAKARLEVATAKAAMEVTEADQSLQIRDNPEKYGLVKATEDAIKKTVLLRKEYQEAVKTYNQARYTLDLLEAKVNALEHRKKALENEVVLHGRNYFSSPRAPEEAQEAVTDFQRKNAYKGRPDPRKAK